MTYELLKRTINPNYNNIRSLVKPKILTNIHPNIDSYIKESPKKAFNRTPFIHVFYHNKDFTNDIDKFENDFILELENYVSNFSLPLTHNICTKRGQTTIGADILFTRMWLRRFNSNNIRMLTIIERLKNSKENHNKMSRINNYKWYPWSNIPIEDDL